jgi:hypothetical protein
MRFKKGADVQGGRFITLIIANGVKAVNSLETMYQPLSAIKRTSVATNAKIRMPY